ncbi:MAG: helix-turn-helix domain-containing protein [Pseudomonadota bacterium]
MPDEIERLSDREFHEELIRRASRGDAEAGREILRTVTLLIDAGQWTSPLFAFLADCLWEYTQHGIPLDRALCVEPEPASGGRPQKYNPDELAAIDIILRDHAGYTPEKAVRWIAEKIGADKRTVHRIRRRYDKSAEGPLTESLSLDDLLQMSGSMRKNLDEVLPHT